MMPIKMMESARVFRLLGWGCLFIVSATMLSSCGGGSPTAALSSPKKNVTSISISPTSQNIQVGSTKAFKATATYSDNSTADVTNAVSWASSNPNVATIQTTGQSDPGLATGVAGGSTDISAVLDGSKGDTTLAVNSGTVVGLELSVMNPTIAPKAKLQIIAVLHYSDGSYQKVSTPATWKSSNTGVATVEDATAANPGLVTGVAAGMTTVQATADSFTAQTTVTVASDADMVALDTVPASNYLGFQGGLYENGSDTVPADHDAAGKAAAAAITPLDHNGNPSSSGAIVFLGIGMSNATLEFSAFVTKANGNQSVNHKTLAVLDGAYGSVTACPWTVEQGPTTSTCPDFTGGVGAENQYDRVRDMVLATATTAPSAPAGCGAPPATPCLTEKQVQVLWIKNANPNPALHGMATLFPFSDQCANEVNTVEACDYESQLGKTIRAAKGRYPNLKQVFLSTRIFAGYATVPLNPEPYAYEYGFSAKWLIQAQIDQVRSSTVDPVAGDLSYSSNVAAWTAWGPYLWAYGTTPRSSDGLIWCNGQSASPCNGEDDYQSDGTHPSSGAGVPKVVNLMMNFFRSSPYTPVWFCASKSPC
jgi:hypothetical protein